MSAVDQQVIDQLKWGDEKICAVLHVPPFMAGVGPLPAYNNVEALAIQYFSQCLQALIEPIELCLTNGLNASPKEVELDVSVLSRMDSVQKMEVVTKGVIGGIYSPNEARAKFGLEPVKGGESPMLQQQNYSLAALAERDAAGPAGHPQAPGSPSPAPPPPAPEPPAKDAEVDTARLLGLVIRGLEAA